MLSRRQMHASVHEDTRSTSPPPEERRDDKSGGLLTRTLNSILRRSSAAAGSVRMRVNDNTVVPANSDSSGVFTRNMRQAASKAAPLTITDAEVVFGAKNYAVVSSNGVRTANEDRFRVISNLELYGKGVITANRKVHTYRDAIDSGMLENFVRDGNTPKMDLKKVLKHKTTTTTELFAIFDGHGGDVCSSMLALLFPLYLLRSSDFKNNLAMAAKRACLAINQEILKREALQESEGGSTGLAVLIRDGVAYMCNIGDCRAVLISRGGVSPLTTDHKAANESEKQRIEAAGGLVLYVKGVARVNGQLAVSRAFGDAELQQFVIANPEITRHQLSPQDEYIVVASDGLWDVLSNEQVMATIHNHPWLSMEEVSQVLVNRAIEEGSMDNVTIMIIDVRKR